MLDKTYDAAAIERRVYAQWEDKGHMKAGAGQREGAESYCIVIPPPNVTGSLHMGHALNNTLQDILVRYMRMRGQDVLWQPGTDHAGIATQSVVERQLMEHQEPDRRAMGREAFVERIWQWKEQSGGTIINQLKRLGASCDWSRERFTMDEGLSEAVLKIFVDLYNKKLIYKDKRLVNWDPKLLTAISDLEVIPKEIKGHLWHFKYPIEGEPGRFITVATTRPETMLGDTAIAVHPEDERYKDIIGKYAILPLVGRRIKIVADDYADPETGSGAVKITPAHDFNDFEVGRRHDLPMINILTVEANLALKDNEDFLAGLPASDELSETLGYDGLDRFTVRKKVVERMESLELLAEIEDHPHTVPHGERSDVVIEPFLTDQWYVDAKTLAEPALASVREGRTVFVPKNWERTYYDWMENIQPWCISRQLWWGHQIPAWYGPDGHVFVAMSETDASEEAEAHYGAPTDLTRDEDVLDTWFSSALWPFSTLGWPDQTAELKHYYQTDVLVTGFDIIFFWVARMMMMGLEFMDQEPFHTVYIHALVRDEKGAKMSKSKGNVMDPLELIDEYGADALRFTLTAMAAQGRDIKLSTSRVAGYRNFATKLWNSVRFAQMKGSVENPDYDPSAASAKINRWILTELSKACGDVESALKDYRFNDAAAAIYAFVWNNYCDWYVELVKPVLDGDDDSAAQEVRETMAYVRNAILHILHPFMPFITEELWERTAEAGGRAQPLIIGEWPMLDFADEGAADEINWLISIISEIRSVRSQMNVPAGAKIAVQMVAGDDVQARVSAYDGALKRLARLEVIEFVSSTPSESVQILHGDTTIGLMLADVIDMAAERTRLQKDLAKAEDEIKLFDKKLGNQNFVARAPEAVVEEQREKRAAAAELADNIKAVIARMG